MQHNQLGFDFVQVDCKFVPKSIAFPLHGIPFVRKYNNLLDLYSVFPFQLPINFRIQLHGAVNLTFLVTLWSAHHHHAPCLFATPAHWWKISSLYGAVRSKKYYICRGMPVWQAKYSALWRDRHHKVFELSSMRARCTQIRSVMARFSYTFIYRAICGEESKYTCNVDVCVSVCVRIGCLYAVRMDIYTEYSRAQHSTQHTEHMNIELRIVK